MPNPHKFRFDVDVNVINHLGVGLYSSTPAALTELVANAWDADASNVYITIDAAAKTITVEDDGHGMSAENIKRKFLNVGYSRRTHSKNKQFSDGGTRRVMGRKGIGKLAMFALADLITVTSQEENSGPVAFVIDVPALRKSLEAHTTLELDEVVPEEFPKKRGTRIRLDKVLSGLKTTESYLRLKLARRFSVIGELAGFRVFLDGKEITKTDRRFYEHIQMLWAFDANSMDVVSNLATNLASIPESTKKNAPLVPCSRELTNQFTLGAQTFTVSGYIASVAQPKNLGSKDESANILSLFANGRVFAENVLDEAASAKYYQNYLVGEIHADFLDDDDTDRATASREAIKRDDPRYQALLSFIRESLETVEDDWDEWRTALGHSPEDGGNAVVNEWLASLTDNRDLSTAKRLMASITNATVHSDEERNEAAKKILYKGAIIGFEKLKLRKQLDQLELVTDVLSPEFALIFASLNEVEEASYAEITKQRLEIIRKFKAIAHSPKALEKVAQKYLFEHLWLLDPAWDRVTGRAEMEKTLTEYIKKKNPDSSGARLDISYRASSGRHVVVELKKPALTNLDFDTLFRQVRKYKTAVEEYYKHKEPGKPVPPLDIYILLGKTPTGYEEADRRSLLEQNGRIITYDQLITDSTNAYQAYLDTAGLTGRLESILNRL